MVNDDINRTSFEGSEDSNKFQGAVTIPLREGDIIEIYKKLPSPTFNEEELNNRTLKYKIFVGRGDKYISESTSFPTINNKLGEIVWKKRKPEWDLIKALEEKNILKDKLFKNYKDSTEILIKVAEEYMGNIKKINSDYRKDLEELKKKIDGGEIINGERDNLIELYVSIRKNKVSEVAERLQKRLNTLKNKIENSKMDSKRKKIYEYLTDYAHFLFYDPLIVGSGDVADLKIEEPGVSEHQGLIDVEGFTDSLKTFIYENIGLSESLIIRFVGNGKLEEKINEDYNMELIDIDNPDKQRAYLFLPSKKVKKYDMFTTPNKYICFEIPAAEK